ncbi:Orn/Lys/Arg family decarboxylase [Streptomyces halobius]|uniref:Orn/Lys/Arg decarboxylase C-terminal domain-containing protein n=1 Tax=Streptomyces halobius TaxID=2879846 RepID=A0ABY4MHK9_9ACTN|nr:hypothetical protein [Streptomyces halobius]UQA97023.1 hypothetical protein K9S39_38740 [Streptomyces halobius]
MPPDHRRAPLPEALADCHATGRPGFSPPGHKQARGADPEVREILGDAVFYGDVLASGGLDDRRTRDKTLERAERLMADAVPFHPDLPSWARDAEADICVTSIHKMGSGLERGSSVFHLTGDLIEPALLKSRADLLGTTSPSVLIYAGLDGWRRQMALHGRELIGRALDRAARVRAAVEEIDGLHVEGRAVFCGPGLADDFDPRPLVVDVRGPGTTGYRAADWLRTHRRVDAHLADHGGINTQLTHADDRATTGTLLAALGELSRAAPDLPPAPVVEVPPPAGLRLTQSRPPRDACFGTVEDVPVQEAAGRVAAEMIRPDPSGTPVVLPVERLNEPVLRYLRSGTETGMHLPDAGAPRLTTARVLVETGTSGDA